MPRPARRPLAQWLAGSSPRPAVRPQHAGRRAAAPAAPPGPQARDQPALFLPAWCRRRAAPGCVATLAPLPPQAGPWRQHAGRQVHLQAAHRRRPRGWVGRGPWLPLPAPQGCSAGSGRGMGASRAGSVGPLPGARVQAINAAVARAWQLSPVLRALHAGLHLLRAGQQAGAGGRWGDGLGSDWRQQPAPAASQGSWPLAPVRPWHTPAASAAWLSPRGAALLRALRGSQGVALGLLAQRQSRLLAAAACLIPPAPSAVALGSAARSVPGSGPSAVDEQAALM